MTGETNPIGFSLRYWYQSSGQGQSSGVYIFRPDKYQNDSYAYSNVESIIGSGSQTVTPQFILNFRGANLTQGDAIVRISLQDLAVLKFDVKLYGIPSKEEVTVNFHAPLIANNGVFYTDSNGLEMQRRELNFRPTWDLKTTGNINITANYYPINSAIAITDEVTDM